MIELPEAFVERIHRQFGEEAKAFLQALNDPSPVSLRINPTKVTGLSEERVPWHPSGYYLKERPIFSQQPWFHAGAYYVQEASSMVMHALLPELAEGSVVLDLCAAPGGKSTLLAGALPDFGVLVSNEVIFSRSKVLASNLTRWGNTNCVVTQNDPADFRGLYKTFDLVLVDAPCSGEGMFRKDPESIGHWSEEAVATCAARQRRILADILPTVRPGGHLIYSTCTYAPAENEENIAWLLETFGEEWELSPVALPEEWGLQPVAVNGTAHAAYRCLPHRVKGEGLFICRLKKLGEPRERVYSAHSQHTSKRKRKGIRPEKPVTAAAKQELAQLLENDLDITWRGEKAFYFPSALKEILPELQQHLHLILSGLYLGKAHRNGFTPSHELALTQEVSAQVPTISLSLEEAISYLKKEDLKLEKETGKGWLLAAYEGVPLGWLKSGGGRLKNHFPVNWRLRN
ncbi:MAG: RsmF rRNA methyltransferase first C-terminal domain-containing protein [Bacteroidota bacterium]